MKLAGQISKLAEFTTKCVVVSANIAGATANNAESRNLALHHLLQMKKTKL